MEIKSTRYKQGSIERRDNAKGSVWRFRYTDADGKPKVITFDCKLYPSQADVRNAQNVFGTRSTQALTIASLKASGSRIV